MQQDKVTMGNTELIEKCSEWVSKLAKTGGDAWTLRVPVDFSYDPDVLFSELIKRFSFAPSPSVTDEDIEALAYEKYPLDVPIESPGDQCKNFHFRQAFIDGYKSAPPTQQEGYCYVEVDAEKELPDCSGRFGVIFKDSDCIDSVVFRFENKTWDNTGNHKIIKWLKRIPISQLSNHSQASIVKSLRI